jgi:3-methylcrotonyl-CoA carboxylase alpha subunit
VAASADPFSPWARTEGWRLGDMAGQEVVFRDGLEERVVMARHKAGGWLLRIGDREFGAHGERRPDGAFAMALDGVRRHLIVLVHGSDTAVFIDGESWRLIELDPLAAASGDDPTAGRLTAPMPGRVIRLMAEAGKAVRRGEPLIIIEAMKMEHAVTAPVDGVVEAVRFAVGDLVEEGVELITLAAEGRDQG